MKIHWKRFPWVTVLLTGCAIVLGVGFNFLLQVFLPSYKNSIVTVSDIPAINQLLYVEDTDELIIFPWDQFDIKSGLTLEEFYTEYQMDQLPIDLSMVEKQLGDELEMQLRELMATSQMDFDSSWSDLVKSVRFYGDNTKDSWAALKNFPIRTTSGYDCLLDAVWSRSIGKYVFFHIYKQEPAPLLDSTVKAANEYLDKILAANWTDPYRGDYSTYYPPGQFPEMAGEKDDDPLLHWLSDINRCTNLDANFLASVMRGSKCERIAYRDEILLVYSMDNQNRLVLFYDPIRNVITGFSCNIF